MRELLAQIGSDELSEWMAYAELEPFGQQRADLGHAIVAATVANVNRGQDTEPFSPADFMPMFDEPDDPVAHDAALLEKVRLLNTLFGGVEVNDGNAGELADRPGD